MTRLNEIDHKNIAESLFSVYIIGKKGVKELTSIVKWATFLRGCIQKKKCHFNFDLILIESLEKTF